MDYEPSGPFITSITELKLDPTTLFEWQKSSQSHTEVPHYKHILEFLNLRAQASETSLVETKKPSTFSNGRFCAHAPNKAIAAFTSATVPEANNCTLCKGEKHPLYQCSQFKALSHEQKISTFRSQERCLNCLHPGDFVKNCKSLHHCRRCQKPHHTLLHVDQPVIQFSPPSSSHPSTVINNAANTTLQGLPPIYC